MTKKAVPPEHSNAVRGVEIFAPGTHNGDAYTEADIDDMIAAHAKLDFKPAIKIGHTKDSPGAPAYGYVTALRKVGGKLVADFESMHDSVIQALRDKRYGRVSSEVYFNLKRGANTFRRALKAVALLGADVPAVADLVPLHKMEFAADGFESVTACEQDLDVGKQAIIDALSERITKLNEQITTYSTEKEQDAMTIKQLNEKKAALEAQLAEARKAGGDDAAAKIATLEAEISAFGGQIKALEQAENHAAENTALRAQVAELAAKDRAREVADRVARCKVVAFRDQLEAVYSHAMANSGAKVKLFSTKDGKRTSDEKTIVEVVDALVESINAGSKQLFSVVTATNASERQEGPKDGDAGVILDQKARALVAAGTFKNYDEAFDAAMAAEPELAKQYGERTAERTA